MSDFLNNLGNFLTGRTRVDLANAQLSTQERIAQETLKQQIAQDALRYNPELAKQRTRQITIVVVAITAIIITIVYLRNR